MMKSGKTEKKACHTFNQLIKEKDVYQMTYEEVVDTIKNSSHVDWIHSDVRGVWTYKKNLMIRGRKRRRTEGATIP